jgi:tRNA threonylcarbamoyladenosine biosynthesis protein TsaB
MNVLVAIETATDQGSVAIGAGSLVLGEVVVGVRTRHAESLLPALDFLMTTLHIARRDVSGVVVGAGPGSFTGVRVAAAPARGLALGWDVPLYAYSSLEALAIDAPVAGAACPLFDARRGEVYAACYGPGTEPDRLVTIVEPAVLSVGELLGRLGDVKPLFVGDGAIRYAEELGIEAPLLRLPRASALLRLAAADPRAGLVGDAAGWEPSYLRLSGAERGVAG